MITCEKYHGKAKREDKLEWMDFESRIDLSSDLEQGNSEAKEVISMQKRREGTSGIHEFKCRII